MSKPSLPRLITFLLAWLLALGLAGWAHADPPSRVARLAYVSGTASFSPGGERDWGRAVVNRPLITGDRLWVERGGRAELQLGVAAIRAGGGTSVTLLNLDDRVAQVQLAQGTLNVRVRRLDRGQVFEIDTPHLAFSIRRPGNYRVEVDANGDATAVSVRSGLAEVYGDGRAYIVSERQGYRFYGAGLRDYDALVVTRFDEFDRWSSERDRRWDNSASRRYVSQELIGYEDLDGFGSWRKHPQYGFVWVPSRVPAGWAPYRDGHWAWVEPWGWTWVDETPWGFAPSHYGRWAYVDRSWAWVPGPATARPVYAPALVAFVGSNTGNNGAVGWFPLGPRDVYRPSYTASREYFSNVNTSNTTLNRTVVANLYGNANQGNVTYANQQVTGAVVAVLAAAFSQSRPVARETVQVTREMVTSAPPRAIAPVAPVQASVAGLSAAPARPPENVQRRPVVAQVAPPPPPAPFAARQSALAANPGRPLDAGAAAAIRPPASSPAPAPAVKVVEAAKPVAVPPAPPPGIRRQTEAPTSSAMPPQQPAPAAPAGPGPAAGSRPSIEGPPGLSRAPVMPPVAAPVAPATPATPASPGITPATPTTPATPAAPAATRRAPASEVPRSPETRNPRAEERRPAVGAPPPSTATPPSPATAPAAATAPPAATSPVPPAPVAPPAPPTARAVPTPPPAPSPPAPAVPPPPPAAPAPSAAPPSPPAPVAPAAPPGLRRAAPPAAAAPSGAQEGRPPVPPASAADPRGRVRPTQPAASGPREAASEPDRPRRGRDGEEPRRP